MNGHPLPPVSFTVINIQQPGPATATGGRGSCFFYCILILNIEPAGEGRNQWYRRDRSCCRPGLDRMSVDGEERGSAGKVLEPFYGAK